MTGLMLSFAVDCQRSVGWLVGELLARGIDWWIWLLAPL